MTTASEQLLGYADDPAFHEVPRAELEPLWLAAANERLAEQRERIPVLARLGDDLGITEFDSLSRPHPAAVRALQLQVLSRGVHRQRALESDEPVAGHVVVAAASKASTWTA